MEGSRTRDSIRDAWRLRPQNVYDITSRYHGNKTIVPQNIVHAGIRENVNRRRKRSMKRGSPLTHPQSLCSSGESKPDGILAVVVHGVVLAQEDIPCRHIEQLFPGGNASRRDLPTIQSDPPPGRLISRPVKEDIQVPWTSST